MELTPKRLRRVDSDPPTGLKATRNCGYPTDLQGGLRMRGSQEKLGTLPEEKPFLTNDGEGAAVVMPRAESSDMLCGDGDNSIAPSPGMQPPVARDEEMVIPHAEHLPAASHASGSAEPVPCQEPASVDRGQEASLGARSTAERTASLLVIKGAGDGTLEFELEGEIYRVKDDSAFKDMVVKGAQRTKQARRTLSDLKRAQRVARASEAVSTDSAAAMRAPTPRAEPARQAKVEPLEAHVGRATDAKLLQAWRLAKEAPMLEEELVGSEAEP